MEIDYQQIVSLVADVLKISLPIGIVFGMTEKLVNMFLSFVFGKEKINM